MEANEPVTHSQTLPRKLGFSQLVELGVNEDGDADDVPWGTGY